MAGSRRLSPGLRALAADLMDYLARRRTLLAAFVVRRLLERAEAAGKERDGR